ncbi:hypothetical protein ACIQ6U_13230 [Lysinibacillus fusiformis]|nr:hypothetical protein [Lysinibacillus sphaericus]UZM99900.1 hypothetical protein OL548_07960 [Lysinibacillus sp. MHQ-1]
MMQIQKQRRNVQEITKDIEGPAPKVKLTSVQQLKKNKKRAMKQLNKLFI